MINVFLGFDPRESVAYHVAAHSILARSSVPVSIHPLALNQLAGCLTRARDPLQSTDFSFSRFLVPSLSGYRGWSLFCDCDVLVLDDIARLWALRDSRYALQVVRHEHVPSENTKFLGQPQTQYPRKNWSSVMLLNNERCTALTPACVNAATGLYLHRFQWLEDEALIGTLPARWNHLVDYDPPLPPEELSLLHYTSGGPWFEATRHCGYASLWWEEYARMNTPALPTQSPTTPKK
ncbi:MAG: glycosyltransferase [Verrucomicrobiae bacterium]|nr:glycosyltransferase [Verrucomicrobiae bacterium]